MKEWYNKYKNYIVVGLFMLLGLKSCQSCSRNRTIEFNNIKHTELVDSLKREITQTNKQLDSVKSDNRLYINEIQSLNAILDQYKVTNQSLIDDNKHYRNTNRVLVNTNNQIINKELE